MAKEFKLPELGENVESGDIVDVLVAKGDIIEVDQNVLEIETDKAVIEVPSSVGGKITKINVKKGESVNVGDTILVVEETKESASKATTEEKKEETPSKEEKAEEPEETPEEKEKPATKRQAVQAPVEAPAKPESEKPAVPAVPMPGRPPEKAAPAAPSVRRLARELGVDVNNVSGTGDNGRISQEDVKAYVKELNTQRKQAGGLAIEGEPLPDFTKWGEVERESMSNVRKKTAQHMMNSWAPVPHVTQYDKADINDLEKLRKQWSKKAEKTGGKLTITAILLKVIASALKKFPNFNTSIDLAKNEIIYKKYIHIGVAVDTPAGLLVPVIRDVDQKNILELSAELSDISQKARNRKLSMDEMQGGCFSISNLGGIGGTNFSPIVNTPEVAILGVSRGGMEPSWQGDGFEPRLMLPLSLSYDHRIIDGADAARFLRWVCEALEEPLLLALEG